jgi:enamine deaminase RidA (YjgF/YER057c/UK114 family)
MSATSTNVSARRAIQPASVAASPYGYPAAVRAGDWVFCSGLEPTDWRSATAPEAAVDPRTPGYGYNAEVVAQTTYLYRHMEAIAAEAGISLDDNIVRIYQWMRVDEIVDAWPNIKIDPYLETRNLWLTHDRPASTAIGITDMHAPRNHIKIDWVANTAPKKETATDKVPVPLAGYSQAVTSADFVWLAGDTGTDWIGDEHTALHPDARVHRNIWYGQKPYNETKYLMAKQRVVLEAAGCSLDDVVKAEVYLAYPEDYFYFERAWRELFPTRPPARSIYTNIGLGLRGSRVEVALIAVKPGSNLDVQVIDTPRARRPFGHEPQAIKAGDMLFISGQMACDEHGLPLVQPESDFPHLRRAARAEMQLIVDNLAAICQAAGTSIENVCRRQAVYTDMSAFEASWDVWRSAFRTLPAENTLGVAGRQLSLGCTVYADVMVYAP